MSDGVHFKAGQFQRVGDQQNIQSGTERVVGEKREKLLDIGNIAHSNIVNDQSISPNRRESLSTNRRLNIDNGAKNSQKFDVDLGGAERSSYVTFTRSDRELGRSNRKLGPEQKAMRDNIFTILQSKVDGLIESIQNNPYWTVNSVMSGLQAIKDENTLQQKANPDWGIPDCVGDLKPEHFEGMSKEQVLRVLVNMRDGIKIMSRSAQFGTKGIE